MRLPYFSFALLLASSFASAQNQTCIDFEADTAFTSYSINNYVDGDTIMSQADVHVRMYFVDYLQMGGWPTQYPPSVHIWNMNDYAYGPFQENYIWFGNTDVEFDLSQIQGTTQVTFQISRQIDTTNAGHFSVNGSASIHGHMSNYIGTWQPGVALDFVADTSGGTVTLSGNIDVVRIGGFELGVDDFCVEQIVGIDNRTKTGMKLWLDYSDASANRLSYQLEQSGEIELRVFDIFGREQFFFEDGHRSAGMHSIEFDRSTVSSGVYLVQLNQGNRQIHRKIVLP